MQLEGAQALGTTEGPDQLDRKRNKECSGEFMMWDPKCGVESALRDY